MNDTKAHHFTTLGGGAMRRATLSAAAAVVLSVLVAPMATAQDALEPLVFDGFVLYPPEAEGWESYIWARGDMPAAFVKRFDNNAAGVSANYSIVLQVMILQADFPSLDKNAVIVSLSASLAANWPPTHFEVNSEVVATIDSFSLNADCIRYQVVSNMLSDSEGQSAGQVQEWNWWVFGYRCRHPYHPKLVFDISYSHRTDTSERLVDFDQEADALITRFGFLPINLGPVIAEELDAFSALLRQTGDYDEADAVAFQADKLRLASEDSGASSDYLGFDPAKQLGAYSKLLASNAMQAEASRLSRLSELWSQNNIGHVVCLNDVSICLDQAVANAALGLTFFW